MPSSYFTLALDTKPPRITVGRAVVAGGFLKISYSVSEPGVEAARARDAAGNEYVGIITTGEIRFEIGSGWTMGTVTIDLRDEVGNFAQYSVAVNFSTVRIKRFATPIPYKDPTKPNPRFFTEVVDEPVEPMIEQKGRRPPRK